MFERLRDLREDNDLKQKDIAKLLHITQSTYSHYEIGFHQVPIDVFIKLAQYYHTSVDFLVDLTDQRTPYPPKIKINNC